MHLELCSVLLQLRLVAVRVFVPGRLTRTRQALLWTKHMLTGVPETQTQRKKCETIIIIIQGEHVSRVGVSGFRQIQWERTKCKKTKNISLWIESMLRLHYITSSTVKHFLPSGGAPLTRDLWAQVLKALSVKESKRDCMYMTKSRENKQSERENQSGQRKLGPRGEAETKRKA